MRSNSDSMLLDSIYASSWDPGALDDALRRLAQACRSRSAGVFRLRAGALDWSQVYNVPGEFMPAFAQAAPEDPRIAYALGQAPLTVLSDHLPALRRAMQAAGIDRLAREYDLPYTVSSALNAPGDDGVMGLFISRSTREGPPGSAQFDAFRRHVPHFARAFSLKRRMRRDLVDGARSRAPGGEPRQGTLAMDRSGRVRWLDGGADYLLNHNEGIELCGGRLSFADAATAGRFGRSLQGLTAARPSRNFDTGFDPVCLRQTRPPGTLSLHLLPGKAAAGGATPTPVVAVLRRAVDATASERPAPTPRQLEVLQLLCEGLPSKLIGARLGIAENTVRNHIQQLLRLLGVSNRSACVARARDYGWLD